MVSAPPASWSAYGGPAFTPQAAGSNSADMFSSTAAIASSYSSMSISGSVALYAPYANAIPQHHFTMMPMAPSAAPVHHPGAALPPPHPHPHPRPPVPAPAPELDAAELFLNPGRRHRPERIVVLLRGLPGAGKSRLARLIRDFEKEASAPSPRILCLDDYFEGDDGYEYEAEMEEHYRQALKTAFVKTISKGLHPLVVVDAVHHKVEHFDQMYTCATEAGFAVFVAQVDGEVEDCAKANVHGWTKEQLQGMADAWEGTPDHMPLLDVSKLTGRPRKGPLRSSRLAGASSEAEAESGAAQGGLQRPGGGGGDGGGTAINEIEMDDEDAAGDEELVVAKAQERSDEDKDKDKDETGGRVEDVIVDYDGDRCGNHGRDQEQEEEEEEEEEDAIVDDTGEPVEDEEGPEERSDAWRRGRTGERTPTSGKRAAPLVSPEARPRVSDEDRRHPQLGPVEMVDRWAAADADDDVVDHRHHLKGSLARRSVPKSPASPSPSTFAFQAPASSPTSSPVFSAWASSTSFLSGPSSSSSSLVSASRPPPTLAPPPSSSAGLASSSTSSASSSRKRKRVRWADEDEDEERSGGGNGDEVEEDKLRRVARLERVHYPASEEAAFEGFEIGALVAHRRQLEQHREKRGMGCDSPSFVVASPASATSGSREASASLPQDAPTFYQKRLQERGLYRAFMEHKHEILSGEASAVSEAPKTAPQAGVERFVPRSLQRGRGKPF